MPRVSDLIALLSPELQSDPHDHLRINYSQFFRPSEPLVAAIVLCNCALFLLIVLSLKLVNATSTSIALGAAAKITAAWLLLPLLHLRLRPVPSK